MDLTQPNYRSSSYLIAQRWVNCASCGASTPVVALALPIGHAVREEDEEGTESTWQEVHGCALLFHVFHVPPAVQSQLGRLAPNFRPAADEDPPAWSNHCENCAAPIDDQDLHCEPGDTFVPFSEGQGANISLIEIREPFEAAASGYSLEPPFLPLPRSR